MSVTGWTIKVIDDLSNQILTDVVVGDIRVNYRDSFTGENFRHGDLTAELVMPEDQSSRFYNYINSVFDEGMTAPPKTSVRVQAGNNSTNFENAFLTSVHCTMNGNDEPITELVWKFSSGPEVIAVPPRELIKQTALQNLDWRANGF